MLPWPPLAPPPVLLEVEGGNEGTLGYWYAVGGGPLALLLLLGASGMLTDPVWVQSSAMGKYGWAAYTAVGGKVPPAEATQLLPVVACG